MIRYFCDVCQVEIKKDDPYPPLEGLIREDLRWEVLLCPRDPHNGADVCRACLWRAILQSIDPAQYLDSGKHSPLPWSFDGTIKDANGRLLMDAEKLEKERDANAWLIVAAVNDLHWQALANAGEQDGAQE